MVYLTGAWGMGETEPQCYSTNSSPVSSSSSTSSPSAAAAAAAFLQDHDEEVALHPLNNQVGGHTRLLLLNQNTICKPLNRRELDFYRNIPQDIQMFVPKFKGVIQASSSGGEVTLDKRYSPSFRDTESTSHQQGSLSKGSTKRKRDDVLSRGSPLCTDAPVPGPRIEVSCGPFDRVVYVPQPVQRYGRKNSLRMKGPYLWYKTIAL